MKEIRNWFPFYPSDWLTDTELQLCPLEAQGLLVNMMALSWREGTPGELVYTPGEIAFLLRVPEETFRSLLDILVSRERVTVGEEGVRIERLVEIGREQHEKHQRRVESGRLGGMKSQKTKKKTKKTQKKKTSKVQEVQFEQFWEGVPNKRGKGYARKCFYSALERATFEEIMAGLETYHKYEKRRKNQDPEGYRPLHPSTWLNGDRWTDELETNQMKKVKVKATLQDGRDILFTGRTLEDANRKKKEYIEKNDLEKKVSIKGTEYYVPREVPLPPVQRGEE